MTTPKIDPTSQEPNHVAEKRDAGASVDATIQGALGRKLRDSYDQVVKEQVPDKFMQLLSELKGKEASSKKVGD